MTREVLPIIYRMEGTGRNRSAVAVFPTLADDMRGTRFTCYSSIGQHSGMTHAYYAKTHKPRGVVDRAAVASLRKEMESIYDDCILKECQKITPKLRDAFRAAVDHANRKD